MTKRHKNIKSPFDGMRRSSFNRPRLTERAGARDAVVPEQLQKFWLMCQTPIGVSPEDRDAYARLRGMRPLKPPPTNFGPRRSHAASTDARKARG